MKRKLFLGALAMVLLVVVYFLYFNNNEQMSLEKSIKGTLASSEKNDDINVEMSVPGSNLKAGTKQISCVIKNNGPNVVTFGGLYFIEILKEGVWYSIPFKEHVTFTAQALNLESGNHFDDKIDFSILEYKLPKGKYRVIKDFSSKKGFARLAAEFTLH